MSATLRSITRKFLTKYQAQMPALENAAVQAKQLVAEILSVHALDVHAVTSRCKKLESLSMKIRHKHYRNPSRQVTDKVGVRIITYYERDVDPIASVLTTQLEIDPHRSENTRLRLGLKEFGYRSIHLIARTKNGWAKAPRYAALQGMWFEIQIRSILEHAWAEIEHEIVYKSGIQYPDSIKRRFARIAGTFELLEREFASLRKQRDVLIDSYVKKFSHGKSAGRLDAAKLIALLECERPGLLGWRRAAAEQHPFPPRVEATCVAALAAAGIKTVDSLRALLKTPRFRGAERRFSGIESKQPTHLALSYIAVALENRAVLADYFPEISSTPQMQTLFPDALGRKR